MTKKKTWIVVILCVLAAMFFIPNIIKWTTKEPTTDELVGTDSWLTVIETDVDWQQDASSIHLLGGTIKTNVEIDGVFINVNGVGTQYLKYTTSLIETSSATYYEYALTEQNSLLATCFDSDTLLDIDVYLEYAGRSYKVDTQKVAVKSAWSDGY